MAKRDPRNGKLYQVHWSDAVAKSSERILDALNDNSFAKQVSTGYVSKNTKRLIQVMTTTESKDTPLEDSECDYINIPKDWVTAIEPITER